MTDEQQIEFLMPYYGGDEEYETPIDFLYWQPYWTRNETHAKDCDL